VTRPNKKRNKTRRIGPNVTAVPKKPVGRVVLWEGGEMSNRVRRDLKTLKEIMAEHTRTVEQKLAKTGTAPRNALIASAAKYYPTLKKLAEK
jgi:hypothetical protein